jgi:thioredoxin-like negative regulator of GroEL
MKEIKNDDLKSLVSNKDKIWLLEFYNTHCPGCIKLEGTLKSLKEKLNGTVIIARANVEENTQLVNNFGVRSCPTLLIFEKGKVQNMLTGSVSEKTILSALRGEED